MATWGQEVSTSKGGNITMKVEGGYGTVSRNGPTVSFSWGVRFTASQWTYNSVVARPGGVNWYAMHSHGSIHTNNNETIYAADPDNSDGWIRKHTTAVTPFSYSGDVSGYGSGEISISVGTSWNWFTPTSDDYTYTFKVPYPAAATYTVKYDANGGSGAPSSQTKYQGYSLSLTTSKPSRSGYEFNGWNTASNGSGTAYASGGTYTANSGVTLYAQWTALAPIFQAPTVTATETTLSWSNFSANVSSNFAYSINNGSTWVSLGNGVTTTTGTTRPSGLTPGTSYTVIFRAQNAANTALETKHSVTITTYKYPYITNFSSSISAGSTNTFTIYNDLKRNVTITLTKVNGSSATYSTYSTTGTSIPLSIPLESCAKKITTAASASCTYSLTVDGTERDSKTGTITIPSSTAPTINDSSKDSFIVYQDCGTFSFGGTSKPMNTFTGSSTKLLQKYSKLQYRLDSASNPFSPQYDTQIDHFTVQINSKTASTVTSSTSSSAKWYYETSSGTSDASANAVVVTATNTYQLKITAFDKRGHSSSYTKTIQTYAYQNPAPVITALFRDDGYGTAATLTLGGSWSSNMTGTNTAKTIDIYYRLHGSTGSYTKIAHYSNSGSATSYKALSGDVKLTGHTFLSASSYDFYINAVDGFGTSVNSPIVSLPLGTPILFVDAAQQGVGVNCFPTVAGLEVSGPIKSNSTLNTNGNIISKSAIQATGSINAGTSVNVGTTLNVGTEVISKGRVTGTEFKSFGMSPNNSNNTTEFKLIGSQKISAWNNGRLTLAVSSRHTGNGIISIAYGCNNSSVTKDTIYCFIEYSGNHTGGSIFNQSMLVAHLKQGSDGSFTLYFFWRYTDYDSGWFTLLSKFNAFTPTSTGASCLTSVDTATYGDLFAYTTSPAYPIGAIYISTKDTSPASIFGGVWEQIKDKFLLSAGSTYKNGDTGGAATVTLSEAQMPKHTHKIPALSGSTGGGGGHDHRIGGDHDAGKGSYGWSVHDATSGAQAYIGYTNWVDNHTHSVTTNEATSGETGSTSSHNNMPPYLVVYIWKRTG